MLANRVQIRDFPLVYTIQYAYGIREAELVGAPDWTRHERYDIVATTTERRTRTEMLAMLQQVLVERFSMRAHREIRRLPVYVLTRAHEDGTLGPNLTDSQLDCLRVPSPCTYFYYPGSYRGEASWASVFDRLTYTVDRKLVDDTGLGGSFNIQLTWTPGVSPPTTTDPDTAPSIFTAVREQLGLKMEARDGPVEVIVVDSIARPTPN